MSADNKPQKSTVIDAKKAIFDKIFKENQELREHNYELSHNLKNFEELAKERESQHKRFEDLEESILKANDLHNMITKLQDKLSTDFSIPLANISLIDSVKETIGLELQEIFAPAGCNQTDKLDATLTFINEKDYNRIFHNHQAVVTKHPESTLSDLFGPHIQNSIEISSSAFIPLLSRGRAIGTLNMASSDPEKFIPGTATEAVESLSRKLATIIENTLLTAQLQKLLRTDPLTGLYNRRTLDEVLPIEFARAQRYGHPLSLIMIDLDDFKLVNDRYGHPVGDLVLSETGTLLITNLRQYDIALRYGGDEFTLILPDTNEQQGRTIISKLEKLAAAAKIKVDTDNYLPIKLSAGLATLHDDSVADAEALKKAADQDLYRNKENKKK